MPWLLAVGINLVGPLEDNSCNHGLNSGHFSEKKERVYEAFRAESLLDN